MKILCVECCKEVGGGSGKHEKSNIQNLFNNFRWKHLLNNIHVKNWCAHNGVEYADHPQSVAPKGRNVPLTPELHERLIQEGIEVMEAVNASLGDSQKPFTVFQPLKEGQRKSFWMKVRCFYCQEMHNLCPPKKNLESNLQHHLASTKHLQAVEQVKTGKKHDTPILSGKRGRPALSSRVSVHSNQPHLGRWWRADSRVPEDATTDHGGPPSQTSPGECSEARMNALLGSLCWGFRGPHCIYGGLSYSVCELLNDLHVGLVWYPEPHLIASFTTRSKVIKINGTFRHISCIRVDKSGKGFPNFSCRMCSSIPQENDFYKRVVREGLSVEKRGSRSTGTGRRLAYLSILELAGHGRNLRRELKSQKLLHRSAQARIVQLKVKRPSLRDLATEASCGHNVLKFCQNIINAHRSGALGGKPALWDLLRDVVQNLNRDRRGKRYSKNTKCLGEVMKVYGGRRMVDMFPLNYSGASYRQVKREGGKGVQFLPGEHSQIFAAVAQIYRDAKLAHNILGPVPILLAEDETKVKGRVTWESKWDTLAGFCGPSENHVCVSGFRPIVGSGEEGYRKLLESFSNNKKGSFARVVVVNPLHELLPRLVLVVCCTCNCFNSDWVRGQWDIIDKLWEQECLAAVGPIVGHASDGDSRRRQLMLADYQRNDGIRLDVGWEGWVFTASLDSGGNAKGLHDQDYIHNGKKLINPLLSATKTLQLGGDLCLHGHIEQVFQQFTVEEHGLTGEDVQRRDRQNWAAAQRLCQSKVRTCLARMRAPDYPHRERTLGTEFYLDICAAYIDIFCSPVLDLRSRIVLCGKVFFFSDFGGCGCSMEIMVYWVIRNHLCKQRTL